MPGRVGFPVSLDGNSAVPFQGEAGWEDRFLSVCLSLSALTLTLSLKIPRRGTSGQ